MLLFYPVTGFAYDTFTLVCPLVVKYAGIPMVGLFVVELGKEMLILEVVDKS